MRLDNKKKGVILCLLLFAPLGVYGYASSIPTLNANWKSGTLAVCILNNAEPQYETLFIDAVNSWNISWPYLVYNFGKSSQDTCNITAYIVRAYADFTSKGHAGITTIVYQPGGGIIKADILIPTEIEQEDGGVTRVTATSFYRIAQHEFGHAIGLLHADENFVEPIDIMSSMLAPDDKNMQISEVDIHSLNTLYKIETEYVPPQEKRIEPLPPPTTGIPQVLQKMVIDIDRAVYFTNETLKFTVKPPATVTGIEATIILYPPQGRDRIVIHEAPDSNGIINVKVSLQGKTLGIWSVRVSYVSWASDSAFALKAAESLSEQSKSNVEEFSIRVDKSQYSIGEAIAVYGKAPKSGWWIEVLDSNGKLFKEINANSVQFKPDGSFEAIFTLVNDPFTSLGIWKIRIIEGSTPSVEKNSVTFSVVPPTSVELKEEQKQTDISIATKHTKKSTLVAVMNNDETPVYGLELSSTDGVIRFVKTKGWDRQKIDASTVLIQTNDNPILEGRNMIVLLILTNQSSGLEWQTFDSNHNILSSGSLIPR